MMYHKDASLACLLPLSWCWLNIQLIHKTWQHFQIILMLAQHTADTQNSATFPHYLDAGSTYSWYTKLGNIFTLSWSQHTADTQNSATFSHYLDAGSTYVADTQNSATFSHYLDAGSTYVADTQISATFSHYLDAGSTYSWYTKLSNIFTLSWYWLNIQVIHKTLYFQCTKIGTSLLDNTQVAITISGYFYACNTCLNRCVHVKHHTYVESMDVMYKYG